MNPDLPFVIKAYTATNQLIKSKPMFLDQEGELIRLYYDMHRLGVTTYYIKQCNSAQQYRLERIQNLHIPIPKNG